MSGDPCERGEACYQHRNYSKEELIEAADAAASKAYIGGYAEGIEAARDAVAAVQAERGYDTAINWSEIGNEYAEGWTDLLSLILAAIDALTTRGKEG